MNPSEFLDVADRLKSSEHEGDRRTAISRSYFAFYNLCVASLRGRGVTFKSPIKGDVHGELLEYFNRCERRFAGSLRDLRLARNNADYDMAATVQNSASELYHKKARDAFNQFSALTSQQLENIARCITHVVYTPRRQDS